MISILQRARPDILAIQPYQHAAWQPTLERLHANEMPWRPSADATRAGLNRYPEPQPHDLVEQLAKLYAVRSEQVLVGRGSDEGIDLLVRAFCRANEDRVLITPPTFGMYKVAARIQGAEVIEVPLLREHGFALDVDAVLARAHDAKIVFLCTPNNPTGNLLAADAVEHICNSLAERCLVVADEAYIEFADRPSITALLSRYENLVVLRTLSKAYALAGARCGTVIAHPEIISLLARIIPPYALPASTIEAVLETTTDSAREEVQRRVQRVLAERAMLCANLQRLPLVRKVWPSDANFVLVDCVDAGIVLEAAGKAGLIIRDVRSQRDLENSVRISIGTPEQNARLVQGIAQASGVAA